MDMSLPLPLPLPLPLDGAGWNGSPVAAATATATATGHFVSQSSSLTKQGWLMKLGGSRLNQNWQRRWFVLTVSPYAAAAAAHVDPPTLLGCSLRYYRTMKEAEAGLPLGEIPLKGSQIFLASVGRFRAATARRSAGGSGGKARAERFQKRKRRKTEEQKEDEGSAPMQTVEDAVKCDSHEGREAHEAMRLRLEGEAAHEDHSGSRQGRGDQREAEGWSGSASVSPSPSPSPGIRPTAAVAAVLTEEDEKGGGGRGGKDEGGAEGEEAEGEAEAEDEDEEDGQRVLAIKVPKRNKTYYLKGRSHQEITLWLFHLLQAQRSESSPGSPLPAAASVESRPWLPSSPFSSVLSVAALPSALSSRLQSFLASQDPSVYRPKKLRHNTFPRLSASRPGDPIAHFFSIFESSHSSTSPLSSCHSAEEVLLTHFVNIREGATFFKEDPAMMGATPVPVVFTTFQSMEPGAVYICIDKNKEYLRATRLDDQTVAINGTEYPFLWKNAPEQTATKMEIDEGTMGGRAVESSAESEANEEDHDGDDEESEMEGAAEARNMNKGARSTWYGDHSSWSMGQKPSKLSSQGKVASSTFFVKSKHDGSMPKVPPRRRPLSDLVVTEGFLRDLAQKTNLS